MKTSSKLTQLQEKTGKLLAKALKDVKQGRRNASKAKQVRFRTVEYLLTEAREYVDASWELLIAGKPRASLATCRWVVEAGLNLLWVAHETNQIEKRLKLLAAEGLRLEAALLEGLGKLFPKRAERFKHRATDARRQIRELMGEGKWRLPPLKNRMDSIKGSPDAEVARNAYCVYRICCDATHPGLKLWRQFDLGPRGATVTRTRTDHTHTATFISAAPVLWLVSVAYCLTELGNPESLNKWWKDVIPLLKQ